jgi:hypothetical protein
MDIVNFFEKVEGTWFSQRTIHFVPEQPSQTGQTTLQISRLSLDDPQVVALCDRSTPQNQVAIAALRIEQTGSTSTYGAGTAAPSTPTTVLVILKSEQPDIGTFLSQTAQESPLTGHYTLQDEVLTLKVQTDNWQSEERIWFMNPNLRMRTTVVQGQDGFQMASFCSEIRRLSS